MDPRPAPSPDVSDKRRRLLEALMREHHPRAADANRIARRPGRGPAPLSCAQERLWFLHQYYPQSPIYNMPAQLPLYGLVSAPVVARVINEIVRRHESLRTTFELQGQAPMQVVAPELHIEVPLRDLSERPEAQRQAELAQLLHSEGTHLFDLGRGPLLRALLVRLQPQMHCLLLTMHHIVSDGWSMGVLTREFNALYEAFSNDQPSPLPPLDIHYADFAVWQRDWLQREGLQTQMPYWRERLADVASLVMDLPADRPRPQALSFRGAAINFMLPAGLSARLRALTQDCGATPFMTLLAGFKAVLHRYTGRRTLVVGFPTANRNHTEIEGLIGFFVNSLVLRTEVGCGMTFRQLVGHVKEVTLGALAHQDLPFEKLVEQLHPTRMLNANPLFQVMFDMHTLPASAAASGGAPADDDEPPPPSPGGNGTSKFDLSLSMVNDGQRFSGSLEYSTDLFDAASMLRLVVHLRTLLEAAVLTPDSPLARLPLLTAAEHAQLREFNATRRAFARDTCLQELFEQQVWRSPEAVAAVHAEGSLTYAELNRRANSLAARLRREGVGPERVVAICMDGSLQLVVAILGVLKAGGAYLPLDPAYPHDRLAFMVEDAGVAAILTRESLSARVKDMGPPVLALDAVPDPTAGCPQTDPPCASRPDNACYVIYTSGSTGRPKGAVISHPGVVNLIQVTTRLFELGPGSRILQFSSFSFDVSVREVFEALLTGGTLVLAARDQMMPGEPLLRLMEQHAITAVTLSPSVWAHLPSAPLPALRCAVAGGAACPPGIVRRWGEGRAFFNAYGPTEITVASSAARCLPGGPRPTIGRAFDNMRYYVVDRHLELLPLGVPGELLIGGAGLARGYLGRPALTAERFIPDPFGDEPGARLYRTGDLVRQLPDGDIDYLGRLDDQVKIRGIRIELGEIEAALQAVPGIGGAAVVCEGGDADGRLIAYVAASADATVEATPAGVRAQLATHLPEYMLPSTLIFLDTIPLTPAGKVDRRALPAPSRARRQAFVAPRSPLEQVIAEVWAGVLSLPRVGADDNFFELGGHSLLIAQVVSRLRDALQIELPIRAPFEAPTAALLAERILAEASDRARVEAAAALTLELAGLDGEALDRLLSERTQHAGADADEPSTSSMPFPVAPRAGDTAAPLSFAQERLWFLHRYHPDSPAYNTLAPVPFPEPVNQPALQRAVDAMLQRHEALRTTFPMVDGAPVQRVAAQSELALLVRDFRHLPAAQGREAASAFVNEQTLHPFDLARGPLLRIALLWPAQGECLLVLIIHHIVCDAWSQRIFFQDLFELYEAQCALREPRLQPLPVQYADFAVWQRQTLQGPLLQRKIEHWRELLAGAPAVLELPADRPRPPTDQLRGAVCPLALSPSLSQALEQLARREGATLFMTLLAAFMVLLHRYTGQTRIPVGTPTANRDRVELEGLIGFFTNTLVLCGDLGGQPSFRTVLQRVKETSLRAYAHQDLPFERLVEAIKPTRNLYVNPLFQVMFVLQKATGTFQAPGGSGDEAVERAPGMEGGVAKFDLMLYLEEGPRQVFGAIEYARDLFDHSTIERLGQHLQRLLDAIVADPDQPVSCLALMLPDEARQSAGPLAARAPHGAVHERIAAQAGRTPDATALSVDGLALSYLDLEQAANHLAHRLVVSGAKPGLAVAVALDRGPWLALTMLAVLKAGAVYMPLDPALPPARMGFMLVDAQPALLVTSAAHRERIPGAVATLVLEARNDPLAQRRSDAPPLRTVSEQPAYMVYTSGSTGTPKGVVLPHRVLTELVDWQRQASVLPAAARTLHYAAPGFDVSLQEVLASWGAGGELVCVPDEERRDLAMLARCLARQRIHRLFLPYAALYQLAESVAREPALARELVLKEVITAGEALKITPAIAALFAGSSAVLVNQYGPSETHVVTQHLLDGDPAGWSAVPPIGRPAAGACVYVLDAHLQPVPPGVVGELCIGGSAVAHGYLGRPAATAACFVPDPFTPTAGARMYRSGDLARQHADGTLEFIGRHDHQVKIQGFRVELGEVEAHLVAQPGVVAAAVVVHEGPAAQKRLVAHLVARVGEAPDEARIRDGLRRSLPAHMVPAQMMWHERLPLTATGKVDRLRLPAPDDHRPSLGQAYVAPRSPLEEEVAAAWAEVLQVARPGVFDNFFELGGHSLLGTQLIARLHERFGVELPLRTLFEEPSIAGLAQAIVQMQAAARSADPSMVEGLLDELEREAAQQRDERGTTSSVTGSTA
jgi:amino acid adenylation domain-containing protein